MTSSPWAVVSPGQLWRTGGTYRPRLPTISFLVHFGVNLTANYCEVCEIAWCKCQQLTALSISTALLTAVLITQHILSHTAQYKHSFFFVRTIPEWNPLPEACVNADTVTAFQTQLRSLRHNPWAMSTPHRHDTRKWSDDYWTIELELELTKLLVMKQLLHPALNFAESAPWH